MVDFSDREEIEGWIYAIEPAERRRGVAVALAARAALRVTPLLGLELPEDKRFRVPVLSERVLPSLRATALPWAAAKYPAHGNELRATAAAAAAAARAAATAARQTAARAADVADAAFAAAAAASTPGAALVARAAEATAGAARGAAATFAAASAADAAVIDSGRSGAELTGMPLWPKDAPILTNDNWGTLKSALLAANEGWEVWTDWYEARLAGDANHPANEALEIARATIPDEIWKQGPAVVNAEIKRLIALHDPRQAPVEIRGAQQLTDWLAKQDDSSGGAFAVILAARAALRAFPTMSALFGDSSFPDATVMVLSVVRSLALPWFSVGHLASDDILEKVDAAADHSAISATVRDDLGLRAVTATSAAFFTADAYAFSLRAPQPNDVDGHAKSRAIVAAASQAVENAVGAYTSVGIKDLLDIWIAISSDANSLATGRSPHDLSQDPLWPGQGAPYEASAQWSTLMTKLRATNESWDVWFNWYQRRILGREMRVGDDIERVYVDVPTPLWKEGPAQVNGWIKGRIAELLDQSRSAEPTAPPSPPDIPPPKPAALEPVFRAGRLTLPKIAAKATLSPQTIPAALRALAQSMEQLAEAASGESNIDRRIIKRLNEIAGNIPRRRPTQAELFGLGHEFDELKGYCKIVAESWPEPVAVRFAAMTLAFERTLRRFPKWVDFTREPRIETLSVAQANDISEVARTVSDILRAPENRIVVDAVVPDLLDSLSAPLADAARRTEERVDPIELGNELLAQDVLESINNTMKRVAEAALTVKGVTSKATNVARKKVGSYAKDFADSADESLHKASKKAGEGVGPAVFKLLKGLLYTGVGLAGAADGPILVAWLTTHYPSMYSWLEPLIGFLK